MVRKCLVVVVDLPEQPICTKVHRAEVVLAVGIVVSIEAVELGDGFEDLKLPRLPRARTPAVVTSTPPRSEWRSWSLSWRMVVTSTTSFMMMFSQRRGSLG